MNLKQKKILRLSLILLILAALAGIAFKGLHLRRFFDRNKVKESELTGQDKMRTPAPNSISLNFEPAPGSGNDKGLYKGIAHSGTYSAKIFGKNTYSVTVERKAGDVGMENMKAVALSAWVYIFPGTEKVEADLVFAASDKGNNLTWQGVNVSGTDVPREKWFKISGFFNLSSIPFTPESKIQVYFWNNSPNDILADDFYIVFGGPSQRRGDSARVDMTKELSFTPRFNSPPYPFAYLNKQEIGNGNTEFLIRKGNLKEGDVKPGDRLITGHFYSPLQGVDDILILKKGETPGIYSFDQDRKEFRKIETGGSAGLSGALNAPSLLKGSFTDPKSEQLLIAGEHSVTLCMLEKGAKGSNPAWKTLNIALPGLDDFKGVTFLSADLLGDGFSELLAIRPDGSWIIVNFRSDPAHPAVMQSKGNAAVPYWNTALVKGTTTSGKFRQKLMQDQLLTVFQENGKPGYSYILLKFNPSGAGFQSCFPANQKGLGLIIGPDTLKPGDQFFTGIFEPGGTRKVFRYNRDWRYDLKEIQFGDSAFRILANIDFTGYEKDHNPKYFESLRIATGTFLRPGISSWLMIEQNPKHPGFSMLPDAIQIYSTGKKD